MLVYGLDPGPTQSGFIVLSDDGIVYRHATWPNEQLLAHLWQLEPAKNETLVIEEMQHYGGMPVGRETFQSVRWGGRFEEAWDGRVEYITRVKVKTTLCRAANAKDPQVRQALIDRWGGSAAVQKATKSGKQAGRLVGIVGHEWSALALAVTFLELQHAARIAKEEHAAVSF